MLRLRGLAGPQPRRAYVCAACRLARPHCHGRFSIAGQTRALSSESKPEADDGTKASKSRAADTTSSPNSTSNSPPTSKSQGDPSRRWSKTKVLTKPVRTPRPRPRTKGVRLNGTADMLVRVLADIQVLGESHKSLVRQIKTLQKAAPAPAAVGDEVVKEPEGEAQGGLSPAPSSTTATDAAITPVAGDAAGDERGAETEDATDVTESGNRRGRSDRSRPPSSTLLNSTVQVLKSVLQRYGINPDGLKTRRTSGSPDASVVADQPEVEAQAGEKRPRRKKGERKKSEQQEEFSADDRKQTRRRVTEMKAVAEKESKPVPEEGESGEQESSAAQAVIVARTLKEAMTGVKDRPRRNPIEGRFSAAPPTEAPVKSSSGSPASKAEGTVAKSEGKRRHKPPTNIKIVDPRALKLTPIEVPGDVEGPPTLSYGLDRALFNPGVYQLQDPRSKVYNFDPYLANIMPITEFDFTALKQYVTSSRDEKLLQLAADHGKRYSGSTSSMTTMLSHFHYLLSAWRPISTRNLSQSFVPEWTSFTALSRSPAAAFLHWKDGVYAIDADKQFDTANVLSMLGKSMEKLLTLPRDEFEKYRRSKSSQLSEEERNADEAYHYTTMGDFMMRSQLDAQDPRLPGTGMFDLKTRAVVSIRLDLTSARTRGTGYEIRDRFGQWESYEREYYDMIRSAFLKYSLQVRMGRMDGIFVAFHNTQRIFGFQYISLEEMDSCIHGTGTRQLGDQEFKASLHLLNEVLNRATARFPGRSLQLFIETRPGVTPFTYVFARPVEEDEISKIQNANKEEFDKFERNIMGLYEYEAEADEGSELVSPGGAASKEAEDGGGGGGEAAVDAEGESAVGRGKDGEAAAVVDSGGGVGGSGLDARPEESERQAVWEDMTKRVEDAVEDDALGVGYVREAIEDALEESGLLHARSPEEAEQYVKALLASLTGGEAATKAEADTAVESLEDLEDDGVVKELPRSVEPQEDVGVEEVDLRAEVEPGEDLLEREVGKADPTMTHAADSEADVEDDAAPKADEADGSEPSSLDLALRRLIQRVAERVEEQPDLHKGVSLAEGSNLSKLREFERILSDLVSKSKRQRDNEDEESVGDETRELLEEPASPRTSGAQATSETQVPGKSASSSEAEEEILGLVLTVRNKQSGVYVQRPEGPAAGGGSGYASGAVNPGGLPLRWTVEYSIEELAPTKAVKVLEACRNRRRKVLGDEGRPDYYDGKLAELSRRGKARRAMEDRLARRTPVHVYGDEGAGGAGRNWDEVFRHVAEERARHRKASMAWKNM